VTACGPSTAFSGILYAAESEYSIRLMYVLSQFSLGGAENHMADLVTD
jgi:hypothetical protein